ncbi:Major intracellular serine protease [Metarhizium anisopliae]
MTLDDDDLTLDNDDEFRPLSEGATGEDQVRIQFENDVEEARRLSQTAFQDKDEERERRDRFVLGRTPQWSRTTHDGRNFLHHLALYDYNRKPFVSLQWLMARAMNKLPHLMGAMDKSRRTPLTTALAAGNDWFSHAACKNQKDETRQQFGAALASECEDLDNDRGSTCLHTALVCPMSSEALRGEIVKIMCGFVPRSMFSVVDVKGRTPLHVAVEYERCCGVQVGIVDELLRRGPDALDVKVAAYSGRAMSVYQYHEYTRRRAESRKNPAWGRKEARDGGRSAAANPRPDLRAAAAPERPDKMVMGPPLPRDRTEPPPGLRRRPSMPVVAAPPDGKLSNLSLNTQHPCPPAAEVDESPLNAPLNGIDAALQRDKKEPDEAAGKIAQQLKLFYLRRQMPEDKELWFDFGPSKKLTKTGFKKHFGHLQFDSALQYVAFPQNTLDKGEDSRHVLRQGRTDMVFFFEWLKQKGVERIIKHNMCRILSGRQVIVEDLKAPSHSDQAIEKSLEPFDVEVLDWRRADLDPVSLASIGQCLREVHLYWSGRNTVLRAWSEKEGLALIKTLETIYIVQVEGLEPETRVRENLDAFERRLGESWPPTEAKPKVHIELLGAGGPLPSLTQPSDLQPRRQRPVDPHKWMQCMEEFASHFRQIRALNDKSADPALAPVKVALIDDGADITHPDLKGMKFPGKSFHHYREGSSWRVSPFWDSSSGHGTLMARLIHRICPSAVIHVIKLSTFAGKPSDKLQISTESAVQAIEYAVEQGAQIISASWTVKPPEAGLKKAFDDAVHHALNTKGALMFCAASDQGKSADLTYPHGSNPNSFRIGAARATGSVVDNVGDGHELSFLLPGHEVVVDSAYEDVPDKEFGTFAPHSGSSVATALAAGLAALIVECVRLGVLYTAETGPPDETVTIGRDDLVRICERRQMEYALASIGTSRNTDNKYIEVWNTFGAAAEKLKHSEGDRMSQLEIIAGLARLFLRKGA